jgi:pimeloyl-ACP methyl ester carboxylesterase
MRRLQSTLPHRRPPRAVLLPMPLILRSTLFLLSLLWFTSPSWAQAASCYVPGWRHALVCGELARPLNPAQPSGTQITIHYTVAPAMARRKKPDPVFFLAGGPGQSAIKLIPQVLPLLSRLNQRRDVVFVDQRGTGRSAPLVCPESQETDSTAQQLQQLLSCQATWRALPYASTPEQLRYFTTAIAVGDLDAVRQQLGAVQINLVGGSYGTRVALEYQRQFGAQLRRSVLDGVAPPDMALPASMSGDTQAVLEQMFIACSDAPACAQRYPQLRAQWSELLASLPGKVDLSGAWGGTKHTTELTRERLLGAVRGALYSPVLVSALPAAIAQAAQGEVQGLLNLGAGLNTRSAATLAALGMHFSVVCAEDVPRIPLSTDTPSRDFADTQAQLYQRICAHWPSSQVPAAFYQLQPSASAALLLSGGLDPVTPPRHGARTAEALGPLARHVVVPHAGHGVMALGCMPDVLFQFIEAPDDSSALAVSVECAQNIPRPLAYQRITP